MENGVTVTAKCNRVGYSVSVTVNVGYSVTLTAKCGLWCDCDSYMWGIV